MEECLNIQSFQCYHFISNLSSFGGAGKEFRWFAEERYTQNAFLAVCLCLCLFFFSITNKISQTITIVRKSQRENKIKNKSVPSSSIHPSIHAMLLHLFNIDFMNIHRMLINLLKLRWCCCDFHVNQQYVRVSLIITETTCFYCNVAVHMRKGMNRIRIDDIQCVY